MDRFTDTYPDLINIVATPTLGTQVLDIIVTDAHAHYDKAVVLPPIQPDRAGFGVSSDHSVAIARANVDKSRRTGFSQVVTRKRRVVTTSNLLMLSMFFSCYP